MGSAWETLYQEAIGANLSNLPSLMFHISFPRIFLYMFGWCPSWGMPETATAYHVSMWRMDMPLVVYITGECKGKLTGFASDLFKDTWAFVRLLLGSALIGMNELISMHANLNRMEIARKVFD